MTGQSPVWIPETALLFVAGVLFATAGGVWSGAQAAAVLFGAHEPLTVGLGTVLLAIPRLMLHPTDPASAWPADVAARLPGPFAYWCASLVPIGVTVLIGVAVCLLAQRRVGVARRRRMGLDPEARFARLWDLLPLWVDGPLPGRLILGRTRDGFVSRLLATEDASRPLPDAVPRLLRRQAEKRRGDRGTVLVIGPTRCGKTAACAVPAILEWEGPVIALSVKKDLMGATVQRRYGVGEVRVFDPTGITGETSAHWSPLAESFSLAGARLAARSIANSTDWTAGGSGDMGFWTAAGEDLLANLFWVAATAGLGMDTAVQWVTSLERDGVLGFVKAFALHEDPEVRDDAEQVLANLTAVWKTDPKQISSVFLVARQMIRPWQEPAVARSAQRSTIDLGWLLGTSTDGLGDEDDGWWFDGLSDDDDDEDDRDEHDEGHSSAEGRILGNRLAHNTLYLCADLDDAERLAPVLGGVVDDLIRAVYAQVGRTGKPLDPPLLVVIDEAGNWPMRNLPGRISTCAGMGIQLMLLYQSKAQIDAAYGTKADVIVANATTKIFFSGISDRSTLDYVGVLLGQEHISARTLSTDTAPGGGREGVSEAPTRLELLPPSLLRQVAPGEALMLHGTLPPVHLRGRYWFRDSGLIRLASGQPPALFRGRREAP
ncbi:type IV secretory system conjugative DNA transfer family protein [Parafrankia sp. EUN1f]|uniref:type IV secretory system conjugative DNA transfer family protein n=1 Tax=Parafrankia sp. EUN1f TaxID=102897 RepID=UPI0001C4564F|nr:type IV secretory system conjugative DNA transfer family protein [Parafrankia sp. EUN1f]EFC82860.1 Type IV secretory pathway VirD4 protein-like protein [Parafrankia sp. EUN1f]